MFGTIINPFDRTSSKVSFLMSKVWSEDTAAYEAGGKEWAAVPMSYIAQWFQERTWKIIARHGPTAIPPHTIHLKLRANSDHYSVLCDDMAALRDVRALQKSIIARHRQTQQRFPSAIVGFLTTRLEWTSTADLQKSGVPVPPRTGRGDEYHVPRRPSMLKSYSDPALASKLVVLKTNKVYAESLLKRRVDSDPDDVQSTTGMETKRRASDTTEVPSKNRPRKRLRIECVDAHGAGASI